MSRMTTAGGAAAAALVVALGMAPPAVAAPWPSPAAHSGESPSAEPSVAANHADHTAGMDHDDHGDHDSGTPTPEDHGDHDSETATPEDHSDHGDHGTDSATPEDHGDHDPDTATPEGHGDHDPETATPEDHGDHGSSTEEGTGHEGGHGGDADTVSDQTRVSVLGGFGAVNAAVVGSAFLLRRRDRRTGRQPRTNQGSHR